MEVAALSAAAAAASAYVCLASRPPSPVPQGEGFEAIGDSTGAATVYIDQVRAADAGGADRSSVRLARALDRKDRLARFRERFHFPQRDGGAESGAGAAACRYFVGNSLGLQPTGVRDEVEAHLLSWERRAVEGHFVGNHQWLPIEDTTRDLMAAVVGDTALLSLAPPAAACRCLLVAALSRRSLACSYTRNWTEPCETSNIEGPIPR